MYATTAQLTDEILKLDSFSMMNTYGFSIAGIIGNSSLMPQNNSFYYVMQFSGAMTGSNLKLTIAIGLNYNSDTMYLSIDVHTSNTPTWKSLTFS